MSGDGGFLNRWSRRKRGLPVSPTEEPEALQPDTGEGVSGADQASVSAEPADEDAFDVSMLPSIEDLTEHSDVQAFLQKGVPEALKNAALRKVWSADPFIRDYIGPAEYAWDFNDPTAMPGFGPLDPETDITAMLRDIMGETPPETPEPTLPGEAQQAALQEQLSDDADEAVPSVVSDHDGSRLELSEPEPESDRMPDNSTEESVDSPEIWPIRKRHGGAVPL